MKYTHYTLFFLFVFSFCFGQEKIISPGIKANISFNDFPDVTDNPDGTKHLDFHDESINAVFDQYVIFDFTFIHSNYSLGTIFFNDQSLLNEIKNNLSSDYIAVEESTVYEKISISEEVVNALDNKIFTLSSTCSNCDSGVSLDQTCPYAGSGVSNDFNLSVAFTYDEVTGLLWLNSKADTPCGNSFSIAYTGSGDISYPNSLVLWRVDFANGPEDSLSYNSDCYAEFDLFDVLGISTRFSSEGFFDIMDVEPNVTYNYNYGYGFPSISRTYDLVLSRAKACFGVSTVVFKESTLSTNAYNFSDLKFYEDANSPYLMFSETKERSLLIEIISSTGQKVVSKRALKENTIRIDQLTSGLFFIKVLDISNFRTAVMKFYKK